MCCAWLNVWQSPIWRCVAPQQRVRLSNCNYQFTYSLYIRLRLLSRTYKCGRQINVRNWDIDLLLLLQSHSVVPPPSAVQSTCSPSLQSQPVVPQSSDVKSNVQNWGVSTFYHSEFSITFVLSNNERVWSQRLGIKVLTINTYSRPPAARTLSTSPPLPSWVTGVCLTCPHGK